MLHAAAIIVSQHHNPASALECDGDRT
ncbi:Protein of unknown function [Pyronema omphalodes CBS 100304]|uniref:Uncharacterized protein n=1 Tax=Pyronema omphalodes (strain CBS 100304) TaxID=1076935 RepID=U4LTS0_PYROM|nr:Protein of unknown function [Pyronema omphalodes CBS 100304]